MIKQQPPVLGSTPKTTLNEFTATKGLKSDKALSVLSNGKRKKGI